ncbi:MAG: hypothetical protein HXY38_01470 [Chloroflexi bacterium]|nr:hypothetical protein [Chloroflexota bacterium]
MKLSDIARYLILLIAGMLAALSIGSLTRLGQNPDMAGFYLFYTFLMLLIALLLLVCYFRLKQRGKTAFWFTIFILALNVALTIFDQVGFVDVLFMLLNLIALVILYSSRKDFLPE